MDEGNTTAADEGDRIAPEVIEQAGKWSDHFEISISRESVRAKVVLSACYLEEVLEQLLQIVLKPSKAPTDALFDGPQAALGSLSAKIEIAFRMGLISDDVYRSLNLIRRIRNEFAHNLAGCDFANPKILKLNRDLYEINRRGMRERRASFASGEVGNFEAVVSLTIFLIRMRIQTIPASCPECGGEMDFRTKIKVKNPE